MVGEVEPFKLVVVVMSVQLFLVQEFQGPSPDIDVAGTQEPQITQRTEYTYQKHTLGFSDGRNEQQHTDTIRLFAHPIADEASCSVRLYMSPKLEVRNKVGGRGLTLP